MKNKIIATLVALTMLGQVTLTASAISTSGGTGDSAAILSQEQTSFNVTVPTSLPITVDSAGVVTTATDVEIRNNSYGPIVISDIQVDVANGWSLVDFDKDMSASPVGLKEFGLSIYGDKVQPDGDIVLSPSACRSVSGSAITYLNYDAIVSPQKTALSDVNIANVVFILGWDEEVEPEETLKYTLATDDDFSKVGDDFHYIGTDEYVEIPHVIQGENITSYYCMFAGTYVRGVKSTNTNVTDMSAMFASCDSLTTLDLSSFDTSNVANMSRMFGGCQSLTTLDLSSFNTSNVTDMNGMFTGCQSLATLDLSSFDTGNVDNTMYMFGGCRSLITLDLSSFNTSNVANMNHMFGGCEILTTLDLSNFDTTNVTDMNGMFNGCRSLATLDLSSFDTSNATDMSEMFSGCTSLQPVYVRTQADADKFNSSYPKPAGLTFSVK